MAEELLLPEAGDREAIYQAILPQIKSLVEGEPDQIANLANVCAVLKEALGFLWIGFYLVKGEQLVLGPFQGPLACTRIDLGKGVCGTAWQTAAIQLVPDVEAFPGHIACSSLSKSEVVVPLLRQGEVVGVLDIDSDKLNDFSEVDAEYLEQICQLLA